MKDEDILNMQVGTAELSEKINSTIDKNRQEATIKNALQNKLTTDVKPSQFMPIRTARFWSDTLWGKLPKIGLFTNSKGENTKKEYHINGNKRLWQVIDPLTLLQVLRETEYELSLDGESDIALFKQGKKITLLKIDLIKKLYNPDGSLRYYQGMVNLDQGTVPWIMSKKFYYNDSGDLIMENAPIIEHINDEGDRTGEWEEISVEKFNDKYKTNIPKATNFGKIDFPVFTLTNKGADRNGSGTSDTAEIPDILERIDRVESALDKAMAVAKTRAYKERINGVMDLGISNTSTDPIVNAIAEDLDLIEFPVDPTTGTGKIAFTDRNLNVQEWTQLRDWWINYYESHTGESVSADAHGNNQHTFEVQSRGDNKFRVGTAKKTQRTREIINIIKGIISLAKANGISDFAGVTDISVVIDEVDIRKEYELTQKVETLMNLDLISKQQAIEMILGLDDLQSELFLNKKKEYEENYDEEEEQDPPMPLDPSSNPTNEEVTPPTPQGEDNEATQD